MQIFRQKVFWLLLPWMCSLLDVFMNHPHFFKLLEVMTSFSKIIDEILFWGKFSYLLNWFSYEVVRPLILNRKHNLGVNYIEVHHFENWIWLKIVIFGYFGVICVFFESLLAWGRITLQINQKTLIIVMALLRPTLSNTKSDYNGLFFRENGYFWLISYLFNCLSYEVMRYFIYPLIASVALT